jgi:hypothetical protein
MCKMRTENNLQHWPRLDRPTKDKHLSLLVPSIRNKEEIHIELTPGHTCAHHRWVPLANCGQCHKT